jgi:hypothetical protein
MKNPIKKSDFIQSVLALPKATCAWNRLILFSLSTLLFSFLAPLNAASHGWDIKTLTVDGNEGIDIADFNNDGKLDVIAGRNWYPAPDFVPHPVRTIEDWNGYVQSNGDFAHDVNGDGLTDVISFSFLPTEVHWYENPGIDVLKLGKMWPKHLLQDTENSRNEGVLMHDLDGDGIPELVVNSWGKEQPLLAWKFSTEERDVKEMRGRALVTVRKEVPALQKIMIGSEVDYEVNLVLVARSEMIQVMRDATRVQFPFDLLDNKAFPASSHPWLVLEALPFIDVEQSVKQSTVSPVRLWALD